MEGIRRQAGPRLPERQDQPPPADRGAHGRRHHGLYAESAGAAEPSGLDVALVNHLSYTCPDYRRAADWYSKVFNLDQVGATDHDVALPFGKKGDKPLGVTATDVPLTHIICRTRPLEGGRRRVAEAPRRRP